MSTRTRPMTAEELLRYDEPGARVELVRGELSTMPLPGGRHGRIGSRVLRRLGNHVEGAGLGETFAAETGFLIGRDPDTVRGADAAFVRRDRLEPIGDLAGHLPLAPDLVVEIASPSDRPGRVASKVEDWLSAGVAMVWRLDPETRIVVVHRPGAEPVTLTEADELDGGDVVPGFRCRVADLFA